MGRYLSCFTYLFKYDDWAKTLMMGSVMMFVPIVGPMVVHGWHMELQQLRLNGDETTLPLLDFSRFSELMGKGAIPFIVAFVGTLPLMFLTQIIFGAVGFGAFMLSGIVATLLASMLGEIGAILGMVIAGLIGLLLIAAVMVVSWVGMALIQVLILRAELTEDFGSSMNFSEAKDNLRAMGKPLVIGNIVVGLLSAPIMVIGYMMCLIGLWPAIFIMSGAGSELRTIIYKDYLAAGHPAIVKAGPTA